jgi:hypothetical protein
MGLEAFCTARYNNKACQGKALLESDQLLFRGGPKFSILLTQIETVAALQGQLRITWKGGTVIFDLGPKAERWASKILHPPTLMTKLGVKAGLKVAAMGITDEGFLKDLQELTGAAPVGRPIGDLDLIFLAAEEKGDLKGLPSLKKRIKSKGAIWVVYPKGKTHVREVDVLTSGRRAGLMDSKVVSFSQTHTGLKFVIPRADRRATAP